MLSALYVCKVHTRHGEGRTPNRYAEPEARAGYAACVLGVGPPCEQISRLIFLSRDHSDCISLTRLSHTHTHTATHTNSHTHTHVPVTPYPQASAVRIPGAWPALLRTHPSRNAARCVVCGKSVPPPPATPPHASAVPGHHGEAADGVR